MDAKAAAVTNEQNARLVVAYNTAAWMRAKRLPDPKTILVRDRKPKQSWQEAEAAFRQLEINQARRKAMKPEK